jgi:hypothetical protein
MKLKEILQSQSTEMSNGSEPPCGVLGREVGRIGLARQLGRAPLLLATTHLATTMSRFLVT